MRYRVIGPLQAGVCIAAALALALGIGWYVTFRSGNASVLPGPSGQSRADMVRSMRAYGKSLMEQQPRRRMDH